MMGPMAQKAALRWLEQHRNPDGSWGYLPGQPGRGEPTILATALGLSPPLEWLESGELGFASLLLPAALARSPGAGPLCQRVLEQVFAWEQKEMKPDSQASKILGHDTSLMGWGWVEDTASWVEPTSYALLSARAWGAADHPRVQEGTKLLLDRRCDDGGWNYGNPSVLGAVLESDPPPTAWACMALSDRATELGGALSYLEIVVQRPSTLNLSLTILARTALGAPVHHLLPLLLRRQRTDGSFNGQVDHTALAALALGAAEEGTHVFAHPA